MRGVVSGGINDPTGDAVAADLLADKTASTALGKITGTMVDRGTVSTDISAKATEVTIEAGKHSGSGIVKIAAAEQAKIIPSNIKDGTEILGVTGTYKQTTTGTGTSASQLLAVAAHGLAGTPTTIIIRATSDPTTFTLYSNKESLTNYTVVAGAGAGSKTLGNDGTYINGTGFKLHTYGNEDQTWEAVL